MPTTGRPALSSYETVTHSHAVSKLKVLEVDVCVCVPSGFGLWYHFRVSVPSMAHASRCVCSMVRGPGLQCEFQYC
jgi:hypothetical protein